MRCSVGIFVGGRGSRMGGAAKGLLELPDGRRVLDRLLGECRAALPQSEIVLVGAAHAYQSYGLPMLGDAPPGIGPLGGLAALLAHADAIGDEACIALACDLPFVTRSLLVRLAGELPDMLALAPRQAEIWEPLLARYRLEALAAVRDAIALDQRSLQKLFARLGTRACALPLTGSDARELFDWDTPDDVRKY